MTPLSFALDAMARDSTSRPERPRLRRGMYLLPSAFTIGNILLGFYAVILGIREGDFQTAALLIFAAGILDALDGRIARMSGTDSEFGKEYDSLADVLTFGSAPAWLCYYWGLSGLGRIGWLVPLYFLVCCATRLARFNVQTKVVDSRYFVGLPAPAAAGAVCSVLFFAPNQEWKPWATGFLVAALLLVGSLMVSTFRYRSFKQFDLRRRWSYRVALPIAAVILIVAYWPEAFFLILAVLYTTSGPIAWLTGKLRSRRASSQATPSKASHAPSELKPEETP